MFLIKRGRLSTINDIREHRLETNQIGEFNLIYDSRLGRLTHDSDYSTFTYGVCEPLTSKTDCLHGNFFRFCYDKKENSYEFHSDPESLCPFNILIQKNEIILCNDITLLRNQSAPLETQIEMALHFIRKGYLPAGKTLFQGLEFSQRNIKYTITSEGEIQHSFLAKTPKFEPPQDWGLKFVDLMKESIYRIENSLKPTHMLLSGGSDTRLLLGCMPMESIKITTFQSMKGWNPNAENDLAVAKILRDELGLKHEVISNTSTIKFTQPTISSFLTLPRLKHLTLTGFHGTEMLGSGNRRFVEHDFNLNRDEEYEQIMHSLSTSFVASFYEGFSGPLFHFPYLLLSRGYLSPFRDSLVVDFLRHLPEELRYNYGLYQKVFREHLYSLARLPFFSHLTKESSEWKSIGPTIRVQRQDPRPFLESNEQTIRKIMSLEQRKRLTIDQEFRLLKVAILKVFFRN